MDGKLWTTFILSEAAGHDKVNSRNHHTRRLLGPSFRFVPDKSESGHRIGRDDGAVFVSTKEALVYRVAIRVNIIPCCGGSHALPSSGCALLGCSRIGLARSLCSQECSLARSIFLALAYSDRKEGRRRAKRSWQRRSGFHPR